MSTLTRVSGSLAERGQKFYQEKLQAVLEPEQIGEFVAIEPETERYFVGETDREALWAGRAALPDKLFFLVCIGYEAAHKVGGAMYARGKRPGHLLR
jgi:hypothetical protein